MPNDLIRRQLSTIRQKCLSVDTQKNCLIGETSLPSRSIMDVCFFVLSGVNIFLAQLISCTQ